MQDFVNSTYWVRPGVHLARTTIEADGDGMGTFAPFSGCPRGGFLGAYRGERWHRATTPYKGSNDYVMQIDDWRCIPNISAKRRKQQLANLPIAAVQEPPAGIEANCVFVPFYDSQQLGVPGRKQRVASIALYAARELLSYEELFVHYGDGKKRNYEVGKAAKLLKKDIPEEELPCRWVYSAPAHGPPPDAFRML